MTLPPYDQDGFEGDARVVRIGNGEPGDANRRLARVVRFMTSATLTEAFPDVRFVVPRTLVLASDILDPGALRTRVRDTLSAALSEIRTPLRVTLTGSSRPAPPAAVSERREYVLPNTDPDDVNRLDALLEAATACVAGAGQPDPSPAVTVQEIVGRTHDGRYYPDFSGVLMSENDYPISYMKPEEGIAHVALGLGLGTRSSLGALRFSPTYPDLMPDFSTPKDILKNSQRRFHAIDLRRDRQGDSVGAVAVYELETALADGTLAPVGGVVSLENQTVYPGVHREGIRVVTFARVLRDGVFPLPGILRTFLKLLREVSEGPLSVDFAVNLRAAGDKSGAHLFAVERVATQRDADGADAFDLSDLDALKETAVCLSTSSLGNGVFDGVRDIVCVCPDCLDISRSGEIAAEVADINRRLVDAGRPYVLIGSGRWGTADRSLGVPVTWGQVNGARVQIEAGLESFNIDSSQGTHFFRELTIHGIGYMHISLQKPGDTIDWDWLRDAPSEFDGTFVRHLSFDQPLRIRIDGRTGRGAILKPS